MYEEICLGTWKSLLSQVIFFGDGECVAQLRPPGPTSQDEFSYGQVVNLVLN